MAKYLSWAKISQTNSEINLIKDYLRKAELLVGIEVSLTGDSVILERMHPENGRKEFNDMVDAIKAEIESVNGRCIKYEISEVRVG